MRATVELRLSGCLDHLRLAWQAGETVLEAVPFTDDPEGTRYNVLVALQEMLTNIYRHAYHGDETKPVTLELVADHEAFAVSLRDWGPPFDPRTVPAPQLPEETLPSDGGGFGIMIARAVMDVLDYERVGDCNIVRMRKAAGARQISGVEAAAV